MGSLPSKAKGPSVQISVSTLASSIEPVPIAVFSFVSAPHSRDRLNTSRDMLMLAFTYLDVMPVFIDFLVSFGRQYLAQHFYFCAFRTSTHHNLAVPELGRSGKEIQLVYNLKSVERSANKKDWSFRNCAVHHSFDINCVRAVWVIVKGNNLIKNRIESATRSVEPDLLLCQTMDRAFAATLSTHLILCEWSAENWRWYVNSLEDKLQHISHKTISNKLDLPIGPTVDRNKLSRPLRTDTRKSEAAFSSAFSRSRTQTMKSSSSMTKKQDIEDPTILTPASNALSQFHPPGLGEKDPHNAFTPLPHENYGQPEFSIRDLQQIGYIEEQANKAALVIRLNLKIMNQLKMYYESFIISEEIREKMFKLCTENIKRFVAKVESVENDLQIQQLRIETMLRLISDRKTLVP